MSRSAASITPLTVFFDASVPVKVIVLALVIALIAAVVVTVRKVLSGPHLNGGSTFLSALRLGAPLLGLLGAAYNLMMIFIGVSNMGPQPLNVLAPGFAEAAFLLVLGLIVGVVAVVCHWIVEARVDRLVLKA
jgi:hypothetical protein